MATVLINGRRYLPVPPAPNINETFGEYIAGLRRAAGLTQREASLRLDVPVDVLEAIEAGTDAAYSMFFGEVVRVGELYGVSLDLLAAAYRRPLPPSRTQIDYTTGGDDEACMGDVDDVDEWDE